MRFYTCGVPVDQDGGGEAAPAPGSFEAGFSAVKAQVGSCLPLAPTLFLLGSCNRHDGEACHGHLGLTLAPNER